MAQRPKSTAQLSLVKGFAPPEDVKALAQAKFESSGLTLEDARQLGLTWHTAGETQQQDPGLWALPSLRLPYFDPWTKKPLQALPEWPAFYRQRALRTPQPEPDDFKKYLQPRNSGVAPYFPTLIDWLPLLQDVTQPLIITEGELKAAKATAEGLPTIGLGGVNSYRSMRNGYDFLPHLEKIDWVKREVYLIFDSDLQANSNVCRALNDLALALAQRGALPKMVLLPSGPNDEKVGLDDFLVANHTDVLREMVRVNAVHVGFAKPLWTMNERYVFLPMLNRAVVRGRTDLLAVDALKNAETSRFNEQVLKDNGSVGVQQVSAVEYWMKWPLRQQALRMTYTPGMAPLDLIPSSVKGAKLDDADYNTWTGWGCEPKKGDVGPFLKLLDHLFTGAPTEAKQWFLRWCAYPIQFPGSKLFSSAVIHGLGQGTGKSLIGYSLGRIYGDNFTEINQDNLHDDFNEWAVGKQLIMGDDVTGSDKRSDLDKLKKRITQKNIRLNIKHQPTYELPDRINYLWTSNQPDAFFLEDKDRRFFIHEVTVEALPEKFYADYEAWMLMSDEGPSALFYYLQHLDLGDFSPSAAALQTQAKQQMTRQTRSDLGNWVRDLLLYPDDLLRVGQARMVGDLFTNRELVSAYASQQGVSPETIHPKRMASELARAGIRQVHGGLPVRAPGRDVADRYYGVRNGDKWQKADLLKLQAHLAVAVAEKIEEKKKPR